MTATLQRLKGAASQQRLLTGAKPFGKGLVSGWVRVAGSSPPLPTRWRANANRGGNG